MRILFSLIFTLIAAITNSVFAKPKVVPTAEEIFVNQDQDTPPVAFQRLVFNVPDSQDLGTVGNKGLLGCVAKRPITLETNTFSVENRMFFNEFTKLMMEAKFNIPDDPNDLFASNKTEPEYLIAAMIKDFEIDYCLFSANVPNKVGQGDGQLYMNIDWQVYSLAKEEVVFRKEVEGYGKIENTVDNPFYKILEKSFTSSLRNLLATDELANVFSQENVKLTDPIFERTNISLIDTVNEESKVQLAEVRDSVVTIKPPTGGHGSGFVISEDGFIITNQHVVGNSDRVIVSFLNGIEIEGEVIRVAEVRDVALVKVPLARSKAIPVKLDEPDIGDNVYAIGAPLDTDLSGTVSQGIVSSFRMIDDQEFIQSDATIFGGNSGGPMVDENGNVVAISVMGRTDVETINYFIPIKFALKALNINQEEETTSKYTRGE